MQPPTTKKGGPEVDRPIGFAEQTSLNRFISWSVEKSLPFFKVLKGSKIFSWGARARQGFRRFETVFGKPHCNDKPFAWGRPPVVYCNFKLRSERIISWRENGWRQFETVTNLLHIRSLKQIEVVVLWNGKDGLCSGNGSQEVSLLFSELQDQGPYIFSPSGYVWE